MNEYKIDILLYFVLPVLMAGSSVGMLFLYWIKSIVNKYKNKIDIETTINTEDFIYNIISHGVAFAEQMSSNKEKIYGTKISSSDKLHQAISYVFKEFDKYNIKSFGVEDIRDKVESYLGFRTLELNGSSYQALFEELNKGFIEKEEGENDEDEKLY